MHIIHDVNGLHGILPRHLTGRVRQALRTFPVVVLSGARQTGKSTLIRRLLGDPGRLYRTMDEMDTLDAARRDPDALIGSKRPLALDEIQRSPELLLAIKRAVDRDRRPGRFLLSGSANLTLLRKVSETLAGRAMYLTLHPFTVAEREGRGTAGRWDILLSDPGRLEGDHPRLEGLDKEIRTSGFPPAALARSRGRRDDWLAGYVQTYIERDLQTLSEIHNLADFRRLLRLVALRSGGLMNQSHMARDAGLPQPTVHRYLNLMEVSYMLHRLEPYSVSRSRRLVRSPKLFMCDSGLAAHLAGVAIPGGHSDPVFRGSLLETLVLNDLLAWREGSGRKPEILFWRTAAGAEVDFVVEMEGRIWPVEVKAAGRAGPRDTGHIRLFMGEYGKAVPHGIILHAGSRAERIGSRIWAVPLSAAFGLSEA